jgi:hypothetical protein
MNWQLHVGKFASVPKFEIFHLLYADKFTMAYNFTEFFSSMWQWHKLQIVSAKLIYGGKKYAKL